MPVRSNPKHVPHAAVVFGGPSIVRELIARLHEADLAYCHWKSNEHLGAAVDGLTVLDVLVDRRRTADLAAYFATSGFKRFAPPPLRAYPAVEDYLGFDHDTGRLVHLHLHYQLTLGQRHLKGYRLPWEHNCFDRILDHGHRVYVADPAIELLLLLVRAGLKQRARDCLRRWSYSSGNDHMSGFRREFEWLRGRVDDAKVRETAAAVFSVPLPTSHCVNCSRSHWCKTT